MGDDAALQLGARGYTGCVLCCSVTLAKMAYESNNLCSDVRCYKDIGATPPISPVTCYGVKLKVLQAYLPAPLL
jgi:hypothetical protein